MASPIKRLEWAFRHSVVYPLLRTLLNNRPHPERIDLRRTKKILILRYDRIGDSIVTTPVFRKLKKEHPGIVLDVFASPSNVSVIKLHPSVDRVYVFHQKLFPLLREVFRARRERYDVILNFIFNRTTTVGLLSKFIAHGGVSVSMGDEKYRFYFNQYHTLSKGEKHLAELHAEYVSRTFGIRFDREELSFDLPLEDASTRRVDEYLVAAGLSRRNSLGGGGFYCILNVSATEAARKMTHEQALAVTRWFVGENVAMLLVISAPEDEAWRRGIVEETNSPVCRSFPERGSESFAAVASLVSGARLVVTVDTSIIHLTSAAQTPVLGLYNSRSHAMEWRPLNTRSRALAPQEQFVRTIPVDEIVSALREFAAELGLVRQTT